jgi:hypothetical protein
MDLAFERNDWTRTPAAEALLRNNQPLLAFFAGKSEAFTSKDHNFSAGEEVNRQIIVINNSRETVRCDLRWSADFRSGSEILLSGSQSPLESKSGCL